MHRGHYPAISIHALREEGDGTAESELDTSKLFLSTPSARRATCLFLAEAENVRKFLSTPSARRATELFSVDGVLFDISIHALREEGDRTVP